jgi:ketosteroid isomerase-like protein
MHPHAELIQSFYKAFQKRDASTMADCYVPDVRFSDPVFQDLRGFRARAMWQMLCERGKDLELEFTGVEANDQVGRAEWQAWYTFSGTGRSVHNKITARFEFAGGKIRAHQDTFDLWAWSGQALGVKGRLLGWAPPVQSAIRKQAMKSLDDYIAKRGLQP